MGNGDEMIRNDFAARDSPNQDTESSLAMSNITLHMSCDHSQEILFQN